MMTHGCLSSARSIGRRALFAALAVIVQWGIPLRGHASEADKPPDADDAVRSYAASLTALRSKPLCIKGETVSTSLVSDYRLSQTLFLEDGNVRLEQLDRKNGGVAMARETCIVDGRFLGARKAEKDREVSLRSFLKMPDDRFNRTVAGLLGADYLGYPQVVWRSKLHDLAKVFPALKCVTRRDRIDGVDVILLEGSSNDIVLRLWLAPSLNYGPKKIEYRPSVPDKFTDANIDRIPSHSLYVCEFDGFQKTADVYLPTKIRTHSVTTPCLVREGKVSPGKSIDARRETTWAAEVLSRIPKSDFAVAMKIPEDTRVYMADASHLEFAWRHGKIVPVTGSRRRNCAAPGF